MPTNSYDVNFPPDTELANLIGANLRQVRLDVQQRMALISGTLAARWNPGADAQPANWTGLLYFATDTQQLFQWSGAAWVQISFNGAVAKADVTGQQANIANTTLYSVPVGLQGTYRFNGFVIITQAATTSSTLPNFNVIFTDNDTNAVETFNVSAANNGNTVGIYGALSGTVAAVTPLVFQAKAGTAIQYNTTAYGSVGATPMQYALHAKLEYLGA